MSESERPTLLDNLVPETPHEYIVDEDADAPQWARQLYRATTGRLREEKEQLDRIERNQKIQHRELRRISRTVAELAHDQDELRARVEEIEDRLDNERRTP